MHRSNYHSAEHTNGKCAVNKVSASHAAQGLNDGVLDELCAAARGTSSGEDEMDVEESSDEDAQQHAVATGKGTDSSSSSSAVAAVAMATKRASR